MEQPRDGILVLSREGEVLEANRRFADMLGYPLNEVHSLRVWDWDTQWTKEELLAIIDRIDSAGEVLEISFSRRDGTRIEVEITAFGIDVGGEKQLFCICRDESEHKKAEEALRLSEATYREIFNSVNDAVFIHDLETGAVLDVNSRMLEIFGYTLEEARTLRVGDISSGNHPYTDEVARDLLTKAAAGQPQVFEWHCRHRSGRLFWTEVSLKRGTIAGNDRILAIERDISDRKRAEEEHKKLQARLLQAQKMESLGTLAGGVAHDFNNLLQVMMGNVELLLTDKSTDHPDTCKLQSVGSSIERAAQLVQQLLLFGRKAESRRRPVDLNREVREVVKMLKRTLPKMIEVQLRLAGRTSLINADPLQVEQVLLNLASNAADAMPGGGVFLIETEEVILDAGDEEGGSGGPEGDFVLMSVTDTGCGMDRRILEHVFDPFFTTKEIGKGTGLGLASVYGIVTGHGGRIHCYSEVGQGTRFRIYWPVIPENDNEVTHAGDASSRSDHQRGTGTILVVDDEANLRHLSAGVLRDAGYTVLLAASGEEALAVYAEQGEEIDLVILDLGMPGMGGNRTFVELQKHNPQIKVLVATGYSANGQAGDILGSGAAGFIAKPFRMSHLLREVEAALHLE